MLRFFLGALALMLMLESLMPILMPNAWRKILHKLVFLSNGSVRGMGLVLFFIGASLWYVVAHTNWLM